MPTIIDVAKLAGVSAATVSRVLAGNYPVREQTRTAVLEAVDALGYAPNPAGQMLRSKKSRTVFAIFSSMNFPSRMYQGVQEELQKHDLVVVYIQKTQRQTDHQLDIVFGTPTYGILILDGTHLTDAEFIHLYRTAPTVQFGSERVPSGQENVGILELDNGQIGYQLARHLFEQGARSLLYPVMVDRCGAILPFLHDRQEGVFRAAMEFGVPRTALTAYPCPIDRTQMDLDGFAFGEQMVADCLAAGELPDAILSFWDPIAVGALHGLQAAGVDVPGRVLISGMEGQVVAVRARPAITTLDELYFRIGRQMAAMLVEMKEHGRSNMFVRLENKLCQRETTTR